MAFPQNFIDDIKTRVPVSDVVGRKVKLIRRGREYVGLSPFKQERTPSFTVNDDKQFYHCFSTGKHGSVFDFLMETEGLSFPEAVERLAGEAGLPMPARDPQAAQRNAQYDALAEVMAQASRLFQTQLQGASGRAANEYLKKRGLDDAIAQAFGLGFAPDTRQGLMTHLQAQGVSQEQMLECGLIIKPDDGGAPYDRFRNRIMFPIHDSRGRVIAFGGRAMSENMRAKYLNSPETPLFHKGSVLYNFARARTPAHDAKTVLVAEGYMDVIALARAGFENAVAPLGTAITEQQINLLWRLAPEPVLCLDGDEAGLRAAYRAIDRALPLLKAGYSLRFAILPAGKDPDDVVAQGGAAAMTDLISKAQSLGDLLWEREFTAAPSDTPERMAALRQRLRTAIRQIQDGELRKLYDDDFKQRLDKLAPLPQTKGQYRGKSAPWKIINNTPNPDTKRSDLVVTGKVDMPNEELWLLYFPLRLPSLLERHQELLGKIKFSSHSLETIRNELCNLCVALEGDTDAIYSALKAKFAEPIAQFETTDEVRALDKLFAENPEAREAQEADWVRVADAHHSLAVLRDEKNRLEAEMGKKEVEMGDEIGDNDAEQARLEKLTDIYQRINRYEQRLKHRQVLGSISA